MIVELILPRVKELKSHQLSEVPAILGSLGCECDGLDA
jgi:hypothetical protein